MTWESGLCAIVLKASLVIYYSLNMVALFTPENQQMLQIRGSSPTRELIDKHLLALY